MTQTKQLTKTLLISSLALMSAYGYADDAQPEVTGAMTIISGGAGAETYTTGGAGAETIISGGAGAGTYTTGGAGDDVALTVRAGSIPITHTTASATSDGANTWDNDAFVGLNASYLIPSIEGLAVSVSLELVEGGANDKTLGVSYTTDLGPGVVTAGFSYEDAHNAGGTAMMENATDFLLSYSIDGLRVSYATAHGDDDIGMINATETLMASYQFSDRLSFGIAAIDNEYKDANGTTQPLNAKEVGASYFLGQGVTLNASVGRYDELNNENNTTNGTTISSVQLNFSF